MTSWFNRYGAGLFFALAAPLIINTRASALDKKASVGISHYIMAVINEDLGNIDTAIQEYKKALTSDYQSSIIHLRLASSYIKNNNLSSAIEELQLAVKLDPEAVEPHAILGFLYSSQGKSILATSEYEAALKNASKLQPQNIEIYKNLGAVYLRQKKFKEAENIYRLIIDLSPADSEAHFYLANIYDELKNREAAKVELKKALALNPDYDEALNYLGYVYAEEGKNLGQAEIMVKKALEISPDNGAYVDSLGWIYFKQNKLKESVKELIRAVSLVEDPVIYDHLGDAYFKLNDKANAKLNWQNSLKLDPQQDKVKEKLEKIK